MRKIILMMLGYLVIGQFSISYSLEKETHRSLNQYISEGTNSVFSLDTYLKNNLGFAKGKDELLNGQKVYDWVSNGGKFEDEPAYTRSRNHFHNPLLSWDQAGLNSFPFTGQSSALWIQDQENRRSTDLGGDWSWKKARQFYYAALTGDSTAPELSGFKVEEEWGNSITIVGKTAMSEAERNRFFAWTFRAVGQTMHLVQDASVPSHTRNDVHILRNYENWVDELRRDNMAGFQKLFENPKSFSGTVSSAASFIDTDQYNRNNPGVTASTAIGLAEYTNANFFSEDTVFAKEYPYPSRKTSVQVKDYDYPDPFNPGSYVKREYYKKVANGETNGETGYRLAGVDYLRFYRQSLDPTAQDELESIIIPPMDDFVYEDYAKLLLPRAVGYSAALLNYFFRGKIDVVADQGNSSQYVIRNEADEEMSGIFRLYYDDTNGQRKPVDGADWDLSIAARGTSSPVTFTAPSDAKEAGKYVLVFKGSMGQEAEAVVVKEITLKKVIRIRLNGPDGGQVKRDILFKVWAKRKDTGAIASIADTTWKYNDVEAYWEVTVPAISDSFEYMPQYNIWKKVTPAGGFDLEQGVYLDYLWRAAAVGISPATYTGNRQEYGIDYQEEETRNIAQNRSSLWLKEGFKTNTQPIPGIEVLRVFPKDNYSTRLKYEAATRKVSLDGGSGFVVNDNGEGIYGLSQQGYSAVVVKVTPSALPSNNYSVDFWLNSGLLDKSKQIKCGSPWTQYPGRYKTDERFKLVSLLALGTTGILEDTVPYVYAEQDGRFPGSNDTPILVSSTMDYAMSAVVTQYPYASYIASNGNRVILTSDRGNGLGLYRYVGYWDGPLMLYAPNHIIVKQYDGVCHEYLEGPSRWASWIPEYTLDSEGNRTYNDFSITMNGYTHKGTSSFSWIYQPGDNQSYQPIANFNAPLNLTLTWQIWELYWGDCGWRLRFKRTDVLPYTANEYRFKAIASGPAIPLK